MIRYRDDNNEVKFVYIMNGFGFVIDCLIAVILENY